MAFLDGGAGDLGELVDLDGVEFAGGAAGVDAGDSGLAAAAHVAAKGFFVEAIVFALPGDGEAGPGTGEIFAGEGFDHDLFVAPGFVALGAEESGLGEDEFWEIVI